MSTSPMTSKSLTLQWDLGEGSADVCADSLGTGCPGLVDYPTAKGLCEAAGARLVPIDMIREGLARTAIRMSDSGDLRSVL